MKTVKGKDNRMSSYSNNYKISSSVNLLFMVFMFTKLIMNFEH